MRVGHLILTVFCTATLASPARAQTGPVIAIPGKVGVPVTINGVIVDGAVIYGDWGLARPGHGELIVEGLVAFAAPPWDSRNYYPQTGRKPHVGRQEVEPKHRRPAPASFHRDWSAGSNFKTPVTEYPPFDPPPVIVAPHERRHPNRSLRPTPH
jgi:hypothetical protein